MVSITQSHPRSYDFQVKCSPFEIVQTPLMQRPRARCYTAILPYFIKKHSKDEHGPAPYSNGNRFLLEAPTKMQSIAASSLNGHNKDHDLYRTNPARIPEAEIDVNFEYLRQFCFCHIQSSGFLRV